MFSLKSYSCLESLETLFHKRGYDTLSNPSKNMLQLTTPVENFNT